MNTVYYEYGVADLTKPRKINGVPYITKYRIRVEVIDTGQTWTKIRFLEKHRDGRGPGTIASVKNKNVIYTENKNTNPAPGSYRLPYKDD